MAARGTHTDSTMHTPTHTRTQYMAAYTCTHAHTTRTNTPEEQGSDVEKLWKESVTRVLVAFVTKKEVLWVDQVTLFEK